MINNSINLRKLIDYEDNFELNLYNVSSSNSQF